MSRSAMIENLMDARSAIAAAMFWSREPSALGQEIGELDEFDVERARLAEINDRLEEVVVKLIAARGVRQ